MEQKRPKRISPQAISSPGRTSRQITATRIVALHSQYRFCGGPPRPARLPLGSLVQRFLIPLKVIVIALPRGAAFILALVGKRLGLTGRRAGLIRLLPT